MHIRNTLPKNILILIIVCFLVPVSAATLTCDLSITSIPGAGSVTVDGLYRGITPLTLTLPCGEHSVAVEKAGYEPFQARVQLNANKSQSVFANLAWRSKQGSVIVTTQPSGGRLYVDGFFSGTTPVQVDNLIYGRHAILIQKEGYLDYHDVVTAGPDGTHEYREYLVPEPASGFIAVSSVPEGAQVSIDEIFFGTTPTRLERISAGNHTVVIQKEGYLKYTKMTSVAGGESEQVCADLIHVPASGTLIIDSVPNGAGIFLNGTFKALTPAVFDNVPQGNYFMELKKRNYSILNTTITLVGGEVRELHGVMADGTGGAGSITGTVYSAHSNVSQLREGMVDSTPTIDRTYTWYSQGHEATARLRIPQELFDYYQAQPHRPQSPAEYKQYALTEQDRIYLHDLIGVLKEAGQNKQLAARNDYRNVVSFVQSITYEKDLDPETNQETEYWKYPIETLADGKGDCEDTAILTAALLKEMGYDVAMVILSDHAAVAIACDNCNGYYYPLDGKRYYYLETTGAGYSLGTMDQTKYQTQAAKVIPL